VNDIDSERIYQVSTLNRLVRGMLENRFSRIRVEGEIASLARPASGHLYFSLKDGQAQIRCAMFRNRSLGMRFKPANGVQVIATGKLSLYEARGDYQLIVEALEPEGEGALQRAFEALKAQLTKEGLFDPAHKQTIPVPPRQLAIITSPTGAAIRDILHVIERRYPLLSILLYPVPVQGEQAAPAICKALARADANPEVDLILLTRGGGSIEDLWAFNEEAVARAIFQCHTPVISGVGHEIDFTIADFVADQRAPTPSAAAETLTPDGEAILRALHNTQRRLLTLQRQRLAEKRQQCQWLAGRLQQQHPLRLLQQKAQRLDELERRQQNAIRHALLNRRHRLEGLRRRLAAHSPGTMLENRRLRLQQMHNRLAEARRRQQLDRHARLQRIQAQLALLNPLATLQRGYAIIRDPASGAVITSTASLKPGQAIQGLLADGDFDGRIDQIHPKPPTAS